MRICVAQTRPVRGDIGSNINGHKRLLDLAVSGGADTIIFPELSLTGYEPGLAGELATSPDDSRFDDFQKIADAERMTIGVGAPTKSDAGISISTILFQPHAARHTYSKKYLHSDEEPFFVGGRSSVGSAGGGTGIALAICYELSVPEHAQAASESGAKVYVASVAKSASGVEKAVERLSEIAHEYSMPVLMANCVGGCDDFESAGRSSVWDDTGLLLGQLNDTDEGILIFDTATQEVIARAMRNT